MDLINAIHAGDVEKVKHCLAADASLLDKADAQGNTPLHYAVAQHDLELIKWLIEQGACTIAKNHQGEIPAGWFRLFWASVYNIKVHAIELLERAIKCNNSQLVADSLAVGLRRDLRFSQAKTLLHLAIDYQRVTIVNVLLQRLDHITVEQLLNLKDSQGVTPLALLQKHCRLGSPGAQGIASYLQEKQRAVVEVESTSVLQTQGFSAFSGKQLDAGEKEIQALEDIFSYRCGPPDVMKLNPLRSTIVKLAYNTCYQAFRYCTNPTAVMVPRCNGRSPFPLEDLFKKLFGRWMSRDQDTFEEKLFLVLGYLYRLIKREQVEQVIEFSEERAHAGGWASPHLNKIYLNHRMKSGVMSMVATLIHEVTHRTSYSYDFFSVEYSNNIEGLSIGLDHAYQLAAKGTAGQLMPGKKKLFEVLLLLEEGLHPRWKQNLHHWMALHSAETLTVAILALAATPIGFAQYDSRPKPALVIKPRFLRALCGVATHAKLPAPERLLGSDKSCKMDSSALSDQEARPGTADSGFSSRASNMEWSSASSSEPASPPPLARAMAAMPDHQLMSSPEALPLPQARHSPSLVDQPLSKNCHLS